MFREVAKAQEVLSDEEQRQLYDYYLAHPNVRYHVPLSLTMLGILQSYWSVLLSPASQGGRASYCSLCTCGYFRVAIYRTAPATQQR